MGATVLHEDAIFPVRKEGIPINIRNTNSPEDKGTTDRGKHLPQTEIIPLPVLPERKVSVAINIEKDP